MVSVYVNGVELSFNWRRIMNETIGQDAASPQQIFIFLIVYRWLSLIPPLISFLLITDKALPLVAFCIAVGCNSLIS